MNYNSLFEKDVERSRDDLLVMLDDYAKHIDPVGRVHEFLIDSGSVDIDEEGQGSFQIEFTVNSYSGCRDINNDSDQEMIISVEVNFEASIAVLTGDYVPPDRDPDEL